MTDDWKKTYAVLFNVSAVTYNVGLGITGVLHNTRLWKTITVVAAQVYTCIPTRTTVAAVVGSVDRSLEDRAHSYSHVARGNQ